MLRTFFTTVLLVSLPCLAQAPAAPAPSAPAAEAPAQDKVVFVQLNTSKGAIVLELNESKAPLSVANFVQYVNDGHYAGTTFHRVIPNYMIQGGGFAAGMQEKATRDPIKNEWENGLKNNRGTIAMARTSAPDSATSQFFINVVDNAMLDQPRGGAAYAVFGKVVGGMAAVDAIRAVQTGQRGQHGDVPVTDVLIEKASVLTAEESKAAIEKANAVAAPAGK